MAGRILTLQRQARELGRLRAGTTEPTSSGRGVRPARSKTWILTSHQRAYLDAAAEQWGGRVEEWEPQGNGAKAWRVITEAVSVDAILPPGDPLSQHYEMWSKGGCQRRCDGQTEQLSQKPCLCLAQFGEEFHLQPPEQACRPHTRLNLILPDIPDLGVWRVESKGFYAANEIAASIDLIRNATGGNVMVPVRLRIEPRKRVAQGQTKQFPVIVVEIRGATAGQILSGAAPQAALVGASSAPAIEAPPATQPDWMRLIAAAKTPVQLDRLRVEMQAAGVRDQQVVDAWFAKSAEVAPPQAEAPSAAEPVSGEPEPNRDDTWAAVMSSAPADWGTDGVTQRFEAFSGKPVFDADGFELRRFLDALRNGGIQ